MPGSHLFNLGLNQKHFGGNNKITGVSINLGNTKGRGSSTRMFNYCNQRSVNPSECINQFVTISPAASTPSSLSSSSSSSSLLLSSSPTCDHTFTGTDLLMPNTVNDYFYNGGNAENICIVGYTGIAANAFLNKHIRSVTIGTSVTTIYPYAFQNCRSLTSIKIPTSVRVIDYDAFQGSGLSTVIIANGQVISGNTIVSPSRYSKVSFFGIYVYTQLP